MNEHSQYRADVQRYLDGERVELDATGRPEAEAFEEALAAYVERLAAPDAAVDRAVMAAIAARRPARTRAFWRWFITPGALRVRPALVAAALAAAVLGVWAVAHVETGIPAGPVELVIEPLPAAFPVQFEIHIPDAHDVAVAGSFNNWDAKANPMMWNAETGRWVATLTLLPGWHEYLFVVDGVHWIPDPGAQTQVADGFGDSNSMVFVAPPPP